MDSFELNKIAGAVLATGLLIMALSITSEIIYEPADLRENGYVIAVSETDHGAGPEAVEAIEPIAVRLQAADPAAGESAAKKCVACHTFDKGGPPKVGPNLYGVVGRELAAAQGFDYSDTLTEQAAGGITWTFEELDEFLANPKADMPGTIMAFAGVKKPDDRADVIAYLNTLSDSPLPLPELPAAEAPEEAAPESEGANASGTMPESGSDEPAASQDAMAPVPAAEAPAAAGQDAMAPATETPAPAVQEPAAEAPATETPAPATEAPAAEAPAGNSAQ